MAEETKRSIAKTITWRIIATLITMSIVYIFTGDIKITGIIGAIDAIAKMLFYFLHERVWGSN